MKAPHPNSHTPHRNYSGTGRERGAIKTALETEDADLKQQFTFTSDCKESYEIGSEENVVQYNIWLPEDTLLGFRSFAIHFFWELNKISQLILDTLIDALVFLEPKQKLCVRCTLAMSTSFGRSTIHPSQVSWSTIQL